MPNKPFTLLPNGKTLRLAVRSLSLLLAALILLPMSARAAAEAPAEYRLAVGFDLASQSIRGTSQLNVPAGQAINLDVRGIDLLSIEVNGTKLTTATTLPKNSILSLPAGSSEQRVAIHFQKSFAGSDENLVSPQGIALTGLWYPRPDIDCLYQLQASLPPGFEGVSEADVIDTEATAVCTTLRCALGQPLPGLTLVAGPYVVTKESFGNGKTLYTYFFPEDAELAASYLAKAHAYLDRYEKLIGPYPYQRFSIVENRLPTGYAMAGFTLLGQSVARLPFITETSLGHEVLHSWFGNSIRVDQAQGNWCEGLTTYLADEAYAADRGEGAAFRKGELLKYQHYVKPDSAIAAKDFRGAGLGRELSELADRAVGYGKVAMIFRMLEQKIGPDRFNAGIRRFYQTMRGKRAGWRDLRTAFAAKEGELDAFFGQWLERRDVPVVSAEQIDLAEKNGALTLSFTLHQQAEKPYELEVPILVVSSAGTVHKVIATAAADQKVELPLKENPTALVIDPDYDLMRALAVNELPPSWDWFQGASKKLAVVNSSGEFDLYQPLIDELERLGAKTTSATEVTDADLKENAVIFLGTTGPIPRGLFAQSGHPADGLTVDIRANPLNPAYPMVLITASSREELIAGLPKLRHYGPYGYLHFQKGRAMQKEKAEAALGIGYGLDDDPTAIPTQAVSDFARIIKELASKRVIYVGESHTRYEDHKLQLRVIRDLFNQGHTLAIGMEMFPQSVQKVLDDFIAGKIDEVQFLKQSKYFSVWSFDYRLYREILNFARANRIPVLGLNIDKENVSKVYQQGGVAGLSPEELTTLPVDRDLDIPGYRERIHAVYGVHPGRDDKQFPGFLQSQAIWDEVMAQNIAAYLDKHPDRQMVVLAGNGHVVKDTAIPPRVARRKAVEQAVVMGSDGSIVPSSEADYLVFMPPAALPPPALLGVVLSQGKDKNGPVQVEEVRPQSPAYNAKIQKGDIILSVDGKAVATPDDVRIILVDKKMGDKVKVEIKRHRALFGDQALTLDATL